MSFVSSIQYICSFNKLVNIYHRIYSSVYVSLFNIKTIRYPPRTSWLSSTTYQIFYFILCWNISVIVLCIVTHQLFSFIKHFFLIFWGFFVAYSGFVPHIWRVRCHLTSNAFGKAINSILPWKLLYSYPNKLASIFVTWMYEWLPEIKYA